ncbi:MAG: N4-gp56 family major capsid protein [Actinobacteria bacterium]|nr:N4-gp56 family major capsid protein [Actinomycetota bacterium]
MALNTYTSLTNEQRSYYEMLLIKRLLPFLPALQDGQKGTVPKGKGLTVEWRKFAAFSLATTALTEGTPPTENDLTITKVTADLDQYGAWSKHSDILLVAGIDPVLQEVIGLHGEQAGQSFHSLLMTELASGSSVRYADTATSRVTVAAGMNLSMDEVRLVVRDLESNNVPRYPDGYYRAIIDPKQAYDLMAETGAGGWQDVQKYTSNEPLLRGEIGRAHGVRFRTSTQAPVFAGDGAAGIDVYAGLFYGPQAWGQRDLATQTMGNVNAESNRGVSVHVVPVDSPSKQDPLNQYGIAGWKAALVFKVLDSARIVRLETAVTA